jgi:hypothetical protein
MSNLHGAGVLADEMSSHCSDIEFGKRKIQCLQLDQFSDEKVVVREGGGPVLNLCNTIVWVVFGCSVILL